MADSDSLRDFFPSPFRGVRALVDGLGLSVAKNGEDMRDQVDGVDAVDVVPVRWAPALNGDRESARMRAPKGKPSPRAEIFKVRGNKPIDVEQSLLSAVDPPGRAARGPGVGRLGDIPPEELVGVPASGLFGGEEVSPAVEPLNVSSASGVPKPTDFFGRPSYFERGR